MPTVSNEFIVDGAYIKIANRRKLCDCGLTAKLVYGKKWVCQCGHFRPLAQIAGFTIAGVRR